MIKKAAHHRTTWLTAALTCVIMTGALTTLRAEPATADGNKPNVKAKVDDAPSGDASSREVLPPIEPVAYPTSQQLNDAAIERLEAERTIMAREFRGNPKLDAQLAEKAVKHLASSKDTTVEGNRQRMAEALAIVNPQFAKGWEAFEREDWTACAAALEPLMEELLGVKVAYQHNTMPPYSYTITKFLHTECTGRLGNVKDAIIGYQVVYEKLPASLTFSTTARLRAALIYESTDRMHYAIPIYLGLAEQFADLLSDKEQLRLRVKIADAVANDPYRLALRRASEATARLQRNETGEATQSNQQELSDLLTRMLTLAEQEERPFFEATQAIVEGAKTGELKEGTPTADFSMLPNPMPNMTGSDDWGKLRPREKQQLWQTFKDNYPERYRQMLEMYYRNISEAESREQRESE